MLPSVSTARDPAANSGGIAGGIGRKNRKGQKILLWLLAIVVIVVVVMMVEDETELRHADELVVSKTLPLRHSSHYKSKAKNDDGGSTNQDDEEGGALGAIYGLPDSTKGHDGELGPSQQQLQQQQRQSLYDERNRDTEMLRNVKMNGMDDDLFEYFRNSRASNHKAGRNGNNELDLRLKKKTKSSASTSSSTQKKRKGRKKKRNGKKKLQPFPVIRYDDDTIPQGAAGSIVHAADALLCRESVIDYVINATDLKDECDGLKKAFTKTCADDQSQSEQPQHNDEVSGTAPDRRRRLLTKDGIHVSFSSASSSSPATKTNNPVMEWQYRLHRWSRYIRRQSTNLVQSMTRSRSNDLLMAEDEVLEEWDNAFEEVQNGWDWQNRHDEIQFLLDWVVKEEESDGCYDEDMNVTPISSDRTVAHSNPQQQQQQQQQRNLREDRIATTSDGRNTKALEHKDNDSPSSPSSSSQGETMANNTAHTASHRPKDVQKDNNKHNNMANLALPTSMKHVSEKLLSETLMLQQDNKLKNAFHNQTNHTVSEAQADAAASSKAVSDANDIVSSVLNDPTSVEARTCCTSILNVFHENCNYEPEEELSDSRLFVVILIIAVCGVVKSLIRHFTIRWLPEAAGCILVGGKTMVYLVSR